MTLLEALVAMLILAMALLPLLGSGGAIHRQSHLTEFHAMARIRARTIMDVVANLPYETLERLARDLSPVPVGTPVSIPIDEVLEPGFRDFLFSAPGQSYRDRMARMQDRVQFTSHSAHLAEIRVAVTWTIPGADPGADRRFELARIISRRTTSFTDTNGPP